VKYELCAQNILLSIEVLPYFSCLVLGDLVLGVLLAVLALAVSAACLGDVDLVRANVSE
jgi:hypothetical protein